MSRNCCICGNKIGLFSDTSLFFEDSREYVMCSSCFINRDQLKNIIKVDNKPQIFEYFEPYLSQSNIDQKVKDTLLEEINEAHDNLKKATEKAYREAEEERIKKLNSETFAKYNLITTGYNFEGYDIIKYRGLVSGEVVLGTGFLSEFSASFSDFFGSESNKFADKIIDAKEAAKQKLINNVIKAGGNAVIGVDFDYIMFGNNMIGVSVNGTAVVVKHKGEE